MEKIVGSLLIGLTTTTFGMVTTRDLLRGYCNRILIPGRGKLIPIKEAGLYDWIGTLVFGPFCLFFGLISLWFFITEISK